MKPSEFITSLRPGNGILSAIGVYTGFALAQQALAFSPIVALGMVAAFFITSAGNLINDFFDLDIDKKLGKEKISEKERKKILYFSMGLFTLGILSTAFINTDTVIIAATISVLLII